MEGEKEKDNPPQQIGKQDLPINGKNNFKLSLSIIVTIFILIAAIFSSNIISTNNSLKRKAAENDNMQNPGKKSGTILLAKHSPGEIIIKLKSSEPVLKTKTSGQQVETSVSFSDLDEASLPLIFKEVNKKYNISKIEKVFKGTKDPKTDIVKFKEKFASEISKGTLKLEEKSLEKIDLSRTYKVTISDDNLLAEAIKNLVSSVFVEYAEPNYIFKTQQLSPNDPYFLDHYPDSVANRDSNWNPAFDYQWSLKKINMRAWSIGQPFGTAIKVGIVDTGIDYSHPELGGCTLVQVNNGQCSRVLPGYDFINKDNDPKDDHGHGTHVAGTIAAITNNGIGVASLNGLDGVQIVPAKALDSESSGSISGLAEATIYVVNQGARVVNMSWGIGGISLPQSLKEALDFGVAHGALMVAAAGNSNMDTKYGFWPSDYPPLITVSASDVNDSKAIFSNYGESIDLAAPGVEILSLRASGTDMYIDGSHIVNNQYLYASGTSMATPHVVGMAALILSSRPTLTASEVEAIMENGAENIESANPHIFSGYGRINVENALSTMDTTLPPRAKINFPDYINIGNNAEIPINAVGGRFTSYQLEYKAEGASVWTMINQGSAPIANNKITWNTTSLTDGKYNLRLTVNANGKTASTSKLIRKDSRIMNNWPAVVPYDLSTDPGRMPVVADINNDNKEEVIVLANDTVHVYGENGSELSGWPKFYNTAGKFSGVNALPAIGEIDTAFPGKEIAVIQYDYPLSANPQTGEFILKLFAYHQDGSLVSGFPYTVNASLAFRFGESLIIEDVNGDGRMEIVFTGDVPITNKQFKTKIFAINGSGQTLAGFPIISPFEIIDNDLSGGMFIPKRIFTGDLSASPGKEILFFSGTMEGVYHLAVFNGQGQMVSGWPKDPSTFAQEANNVPDYNIVIGNVIPSSPYDEIILQGHTSFIVSSDGRLLGQKIIDNDYGIPFTSVILGDINNDNILDSIITDDTYDNKYIDYFSSVNIPGFPKPYPEVFNNMFLPITIMAKLGDNQKTEVIAPYYIENQDYSTEYGYKSFKYDSGALVNGDISQITLVKNLPFQVTNPYPLGTIQYPSIGDINGDGKAEIIAATNYVGYFVTNVYLTNLTLGKKYWTQVLGNERHTGSYYDPNQVTPTSIPTATPTTRPISCSGFLGASLWSRNFGTATASGTWNSQNTFPRVLADVNGDSKKDIVGFAGAGVYVSLSTTTSFGNMTLWTNQYGTLSTPPWPENNLVPRTAGDVNGDGKADIVGFANDGVYVSLSTGNAFGSRTRWTTIIGTTPAGGSWGDFNTHPRMAADVNGDGKADLVGFGAAGVYVSLSTGSGFGPLKKWSSSFGTVPSSGTWISYDLFPRMLADVNGDSKADVVGFANNGTYVALSNGSTFGPMTKWSSQFGALQASGSWQSQNLFPRTMADINGDNKYDIVGFGAQGTYVSLSDGTKFLNPTCKTNQFGSSTGSGSWVSNDLHPRFGANVNNDTKAEIVGFGGNGVYVSRGN